MKNLLTKTVLAVALLTGSASAADSKINLLTVVSPNDFKIENLKWRYKPNANTCVLENQAEIYAKFYKNRCTVYTHNNMRTGYVAECKTPENQARPIQIFAMAKNKQDCLFTGKTAKFALKINDKN